MQKKTQAAKRSRKISKTKPVKAAAKSVRRARPTKKQVKKKTTRYTKTLLKKGAKILEGGVGKIEQGAEKLGNVLLKSFRS